MVDISPKKLGEIKHWGSSDNKAFEASAIIWK